MASFPISMHGRNGYNTLNIYLAHTWVNVAFSVKLVLNYVTTWKGSASLKNTNILQFTDIKGFREPLHKVCRNNSFKKIMAS